MNIRHVENFEPVVDGDDPKGRLLVGHYVEARVPGISLEDIERGTWSSGTVDEQVAYLDAEGEFD